MLSRDAFRRHIGTGGLIFELPLHRKAVPTPILRKALSRLSVSDGWGNRRARRTKQLLAERLSIALML